MRLGDRFANQMGWMSKNVLIWVVFATMLAGCKADSDNIEAWKETVKGPTRLVAVIGSDHYSDDLRTQAALAIVEMDRSDVSSLTLLKEAFDQLRHEDPEAGEMIVAAMVPRLAALLAEESASDDTAALQAQVRAKDAAYLVIP